MTEKPRRLQTATERDMEGLAARRERQAAPAVEVHDENSANYSGEALLEMRGGRTPEKRFEKLEAFKDQATVDIGAIKLSIAKIEGDQKAQTVSLKNIEKHLDEAAKREHVTFTAKVEVEKAQQTALVEVNKAEQLDTIDARKAKRALVAKLLAGGGIIGAAIAKLLGYAGVI